jgi:hypothetical protein
MIRQTVLLACILVFAAVGYSQTMPADSKTPDTAADAVTPDAILKATYDVISGPAGKQRDWDRLRSLCVPDVRFIVLTKPGSDQPVHSYDFNAFMDAAQKALQSEGFYEKSVANHAERWDRIAQVFSTYESRHNANDAKPFERGINSFQLANDGKRWWVVNIYWERETPEAPIPKKYLR